MVKKSLILALIILAAHGVFHWKIIPKTKVARHLFQLSNLTAQEYLYSADNHDNIIVGTSLSNALPGENLPEFYKLTFPGLSPLDALDLVAFRQNPPKRVFIEINYFAKAKNPSFAQALQNPIMYYSRKYIPNLRDGLQPLDWVAIGIDKIWRKVDHTVPTPTHAEAKADERFEAAVEKEKTTRYATVPEKELFEEYLADLKQYVDKLQARGVEVIFFEAPVNPALCDMPLATATRKAINETFPPDRYKHIPVPDCNEYHTVDGIHLGYDEAVKYIEYFKKKAF